MFYRASSLFRLDDLAAAIPAYEELVARAPGSIWAAESRYQIGICRQRLGDPSAAADAFRRVRADYETSRWARLAEDRLREMGVGLSPSPTPAAAPGPPVSR
jgi:TolA-binding protein